MPDVDVPAARPPSQLPRADFYAFTKSLETYEETMDPSTVFILGTDSELLRFLRQPQ